MKKFIFFLILPFVFAGCGQIEKDYKTNVKEVTTEIFAKETTEKATIKETEVKTPDITLQSDKNEILIGYDSNIVVFIAQTTADIEEIPLIDSSTGETVLMLSDIEDGIKGDGLFKGELEMNIDIDSEPDISEDIYYYYYAELPDGERSETVKIWVVEPFTDKELDNFEKIDIAIEEILDSGEYKKLSYKERAEKITAVLKEFESQGLIDKGSICVDDDFHNVSYSTSGMGCVITFDEFDRYMN